MKSSRKKIFNFQTKKNAYTMCVYYGFMNTLLYNRRERCKTNNMTVRQFL